MKPKRPTETDLLAIVQNGFEAPATKGPGGPDARPRAGTHCHARAHPGGRSCSLRAHGAGSPSPSRRICDTA